MFHHWYSSFTFSVQEIWTRISSAKPGSENIALNSFVYIAYKTFLMLLTKESELSLVLFLVKLMHCLNTILCIFHWHTEQKDMLSIKIFINLFFTKWQAIPFKRKFYCDLSYLNMVSLAKQKCIWHSMKWRNLCLRYIFSLNRTFGRICVYPYNLRSIILVVLMF